MNTVKSRREAVIKYRHTEKGKAARRRERDKYLLKYGISYIKGLRLKAISLLGNECVRCGFNDIRALQIDHISGGGAKEYKRIGFYYVYKDVFENPQRYQILCANCNWIKREENRECYKK